MKIVDILLSDKKIDVNSLDNDGQNALYYAESNENGLSKEIVSRLTKKGVMKRMASFNNTAALNMENQYCNKEEVQLRSERKKSDAVERKKQDKKLMYTSAKSIFDLKNGNNLQFIILALLSFCLRRFILEILQLKKYRHCEPIFQIIKPKNLGLNCCVALSASYHNEPDCRELQEKGGNQIYNCAIHKQTASVS